MPAMVFPAPCPVCGGTRKFIEFKAEPCTPAATARAAAGSEAAREPGAEGERRYGFRCLACKTIFDEELVDQEGVRHRWAEGKHITA